MDKFVQLTCSASDFNHTLSSHIQFVLHHKNTMCPLCPKQKRHTVKVYSFLENRGMADIVDSLLKDHYSGSGKFCPIPLLILIFLPIPIFRLSANSDFSAHSDFPPIPIFPTIPVFRPWNGRSGWKGRNGRNGLNGRNFNRKNRNGWNFPDPGYVWH